MIQSILLGKNLKDGADLLFKGERYEYLFGEIHFGLFLKIETSSVECPIMQEGR